MNRFIAWLVIIPNIFGSPATVVYLLVIAYWLVRWLWPRRPMPMQTALCHARFAARA